MTPYAITTPAPAFAPAAGSVRPGLMPPRVSGSRWLVLAGLVVAVVLGISQLSLPGLGALRAGLSIPAPVSGPVVEAPVAAQWPVGLREAASAAITAQAYLARPGHAGAWQVTNPAQGLRAEFTPAGVRVHPTGGHAGGWALGLAPSGIGRGPDLAPLPAARIEAQGGRVDYHRGAVREWYVNDTRGLQQGFTLTHPPRAPARSPSGWSSPPA